MAAKKNKSIDTKAADKTKKGPCSGIDRSPEAVYERTMESLGDFVAKLERTAANADKTDNKKLAKKIRGTATKIERIRTAA